MPVARADPDVTGGEGGEGGELSDEAAIAAVSVHPEMHPALASGPVPASTCARQLVYVFEPNLRLRGACGPCSSATTAQRATIKKHGRGGGIPVVDKLVTACRAAHARVRSHAEQPHEHEQTARCHTARCHHPKTRKRFHSSFITTLRKRLVPAMPKIARSSRGSGHHIRPKIVRSSDGGHECR